MRVPGVQTLPTRQPASLKKQHQHGSRNQHHHHRLHRHSSRARSSSPSRALLLPDGGGDDDDDDQDADDALSADQRKRCGAGSFNLHSLFRSSSAGDANRS